MSEPTENQNPTSEQQDNEAMERYGSIPNKKTNFMLKKLQGRDKQRFDSADFEMKKQIGNKAPSPSSGLTPNKQEVPENVDQ